MGGCAIVYMQILCHFIPGTWVHIEDGGPGTNPLQILRDDCSVNFSYIFPKDRHFYVHQMHWENSLKI